MAITKITSGVLGDGAIDNSKIAANTITTNQLHSSFTLDGVTEGASELYFTTARARASVSAGGDISYNSSTGVVSYTTPTTIASIANHDTGDLAEGTNLYYTDARADARTQGKSLIPTANNTYSLGNSSMQWHSLYVGPGSLYIAGKKVIEDNSDTITISTDTNQDLRVETSGSGNIELLTGGSGLIEAKSTLQILTGKRITDSAGTNVELGDPIHMNSNKITNLGTPSASTDAATKAYADTKAPLASPTLTGTPLAPTAANTVNNTQIATTNFVTNKIQNLIGGAPGTLDTLNELAAAINDDSNYNSTLTTALATKAPLASPTFTGTVTSGPIASGNITSSGQIMTTQEGANSLKTRFLMGKDSGNTNDGDLYINYGSSHDVHIGAGGSSDLTVAGSITAGAAGVSTPDHRVPTGTGYITYSPANQASDVLNIRKYGTVQQRFDQYGVTFPTGSVGINNTSPNSQYFNNLVVGDNSAGDKGITIRANSANKGVLAFSDTDSADANRYTGYIAYQHTDNSMRFHTNGGGERMRIGSNGDLTLKSAGVVTLKAAPNGSTYGDGFNAMTVTGTGNAPYTSTIGFSNYGVTDAMVIKGGNVGIGITNPTTQLHMKHASGPTLMMTRTSTNTSGEMGQIVFGNADWDSSMARIVAVQDGTNDGARLEFQTQYNAAQTEQIRMVIKKDGKVGIGTSTPAALLHLKSTVNSVGPSLIFENTNNAQTMNIDYWNNGGAVQSRIQYAEGPAAWYFQPNVSSGDSALTIHYDATVDAGGTPSGSARTHGVVVSDDHRNGLLGTTLGDTQRVFGIHSKSHNQDYLTFRTRRITDGQSGWNHAVWDITRDIDNTSDLYRYMTFGIGDLVVNEFGANMDFRVESDSNANMLFVNGGTNKVGIGTGVADETLSVNGGLKMGGSNSRIYFGAVGSTSYRALEGSTGGGLLQVGEGYTDITLQGNVGIGTVGPEQLLQVKTASTSTSQVHLPVVVGGSTHVAGYTVGIGLDPEGYGYRNKMALVAEGTNNGWSRGKLHFLMRNDSSTTNVTLADSKVTLLEDGKFGIGTNNPTQTLEVVNGTSYKGIHIRGSNAPNLTFAQNSTTTPQWKVGISGNNGAYFGISTGTVNQDRITIKDNGAVGIGDYTPSHKLDVNGVIGIKGNAAIDSDGTSHYFKTPSGGAMYFYHGAANIMYLSSAGLLPGTDNARDLGSTSKRWRNVYTTDLHLSNEGKPEGNEVDGTTGNWTIQEGEENLYIINNKSGKKYKFALEEIT